MYISYVTVMKPIDFHGRKSNLVFKSPRYTGGDFMFLYRFVRRCQIEYWPP